MFSKKLTGDVCQPDRISLTRFDEKVQRWVIDPVERYDVWAPKSGKPGNTGSAPFSVSGESLKPCQ